MRLLIPLVLTGCASGEAIDLNGTWNGTFSGCDDPSADVNVTVIVTNDLPALAAIELWDAAGGGCDSSTDPIDNPASGLDAQIAVTCGGTTIDFDLDLAVTEANALDGTATIGLPDGEVSCGMSLTRRP